MSTSGSASEPDARGCSGAEMGRLNLSFLEGCKDGDVEAVAALIPDVELDFRDKAAPHC